MKVKVERGASGFFPFRSFFRGKFLHEPRFVSFDPEVQPKLMTASHVCAWLACGLAHGENELEAN